MGSLPKWASLRGGLRAGRGMLQWKHTCGADMLHVPTESIPQHSLGRGVAASVSRRAESVAEGGEQIQRLTPVQFNPLPSRGCYHALRNAVTPQAGLIIAIGLNRCAVCSGTRFR